MIKRQKDGWKTGWMGPARPIPLFCYSLSPTLYFLLFCFDFCGCEFAVWRLGKMAAPWGWNDVVACM